jgi:hypothetical protein
MISACWYIDSTINFEAPMSIHQEDKNREPDSMFLPGEVEFLVPGNRCRLLDGRRTPGVIVAVFVESAMFRWRITAFEDEGACWDQPIERVTRYQFPKVAERLDPSAAEALRQRGAFLDKDLVVSALEADRIKSDREIARVQAEAVSWISSESVFLRSGKVLDFSDRLGPFEAASDFLRFMETHGLKESEIQTAANIVSNPESGEWVKGMKIVLAEMGIRQYHGKAPRTTDIFEGRGARPERARYLIHRLAFLRAFFGSMGIDNVSLFRGVSVEWDWRAGGMRTFTHWTFSREVAESFGQEGLDGTFKHGYLIRRTFPVSKLLMTYIETARMNNQFKEAEALVLTDESDRTLW